MKNHILKALVVAIFSSVIAALQASAQQLTFENDVDRYGQDYRSFNLSSADPGACQKVCGDESQCRAFTYVPPGVQGSTARCYLKSGQPLARRTAGMVSGIRVPSQQLTFENDVDRYGQTIGVSTFEVLPDPWTESGGF